MRFPKIKFKPQTVIELQKAVAHFGEAKTHLEKIVRKRIWSEDYLKMKKSLGLAMVRATIASNRKRLKTLNSLEQNQEKSLEPNG